MRQAGWVWGRDRRRDRGDLAGAVAAVVAGPVDIDGVGRSRRSDLEVDRLAHVHADVGGEALDRVPAAVDVPLDRRVAGHCCSPAR